MKSNRFWLITFGAIIMASALVAIFIGQVQSFHARIYKDGLLVETVNLIMVEEPYTLEINGNDGLNVLEVESGRLRISKADCPDGTCIRQGWKNGGSTPIVCLPNRVVVTFDGFETQVDAVAG